ncbi:MAG: prokaryotic E2 ligase family D protein, partial [Alicyclobacillus sp.]|nr:prokaryotic E2 ligase family D protein [Alicyclobacillus sp.]
PMVYQGVSYLVHIPTMVYRVRWNQQDRRLISLYLAITTDTAATEGSPLYRWPYSNVFADGRVCWTHNTVCELHEVVEKGVFGFLGTPNNRDLFGVGTSQNSPHRDYAAFLEAVQAQGEIPNKWMIPFGRTVAEFHNAYRAERY